MSKQNTLPVQSPRRTLATSSAGPIAHPISRLIVGCAALLLLLLCVPSAARAQMGGDDPVSAAGYIDAAPLVAGSSGNIVIELTIGQKYHIQSAKPLDDNFIATKVTPEATPGITFGAPRYPQHQVIDAAGMSDSGKLAVYEDSAQIVIPYQIATDAKPGPITLKFATKTQACDDKSCQPPSTHHVTLDVTIAAAGATAKPANETLVKTALAQKFLADAAATAPATSAPATTAPAAAAAPPPTAAAATASPGVDVVLLSEDDQVKRIAATDYHPGNHKDYPLIVIILSALAGGVILNVMPCVLPVIPLKVLGLVQQAHGDRRQAVLHGLVFSAGIISLFVVLAIILSTFGLFYGQQFQSTAFLVAMAMFVLALALSMLGVWTINPPRAVYTLDQPHSGLAGSFMNGVLATLLATPCSAPFLGSVLAWALTKPAWIAVLTLALVGIGMSLPYLILAAFPAALSKIPRAGRWSDLLKQSLGIVMIGVSFYLITCVGNATYWRWIFFGAVILALVCWAWGQIPTLSTPTATTWAIRLCAVAIGIFISYGLVQLAVADNVAGPPPAGANVVHLSDETTGWLPFNLALVDEGLRQHRPVLVDWTASWCPNCHFVEGHVLENAEVKEAFRKSKAVLLRADITNTSPAAEALMHKFQSQSIPVLAIFSSAAPTTPTVLRDIYSRDSVLSELRTQ